MSLTAKRELESPAPESSSKKRKTETEDGYNPKNLLKSGSIPNRKAYQRRDLILDLYIAPTDTVEPMRGVEHQLDDVLLTYVKEAGGILMGWDAPRFLDSSARILEESPFSYARIAVQTIIWRPRRGEELEGSIKLMGPSHIGLLILGTFNASIPLPGIPQDWTFEEDDVEDGYWKDGNGTPLSLDQSLHFKTVNIKKGANILSVEGSLLEQVFQPKYEDASQKMEEDSPAKKSKAERKAEKERKKLEKEARKSLSKAS